MREAACEGCRVIFVAKAGEIVVGKGRCPYCGRKLMGVRVKGWSRRNVNPPGIYTRGQAARDWVGINVFGETRPTTPQGR